MPYVNPVIGYWDGAGYTHCVDCRSVPVRWADASVFRVAMDVLTPIDSGNGAAIGCVCDYCGADVGALYDPSNRVKATP